MCRDENARVKRVSKSYDCRRFDVYYCCTCHEAFTFVKLITSLTTCYDYRRIHLANTTHSKAVHSVFEYKKKKLFEYKNEKRFTVE
jgi:hypothetical protein